MKDSGQHRRRPVDVPITKLAREIISICDDQHPADRFCNVTPHGPATYTGHESRSRGPTGPARPRPPLPTQPPASRASSAPRGPDIRHTTGHRIRRWLFLARLSGSRNVAEAKRRVVGGETSTKCGTRPRDRCSTSRCGMDGSANLGTRIRGKRRRSRRVLGQKTTGWRAIVRHHPKTFAIILKVVGPVVTMARWWI